MSASVTLSVSLAATNAAGLSIGVTSGYTPLVTTMLADNLISESQTFASGTWSEINVGDVATVQYLMIVNPGAADLKLSYNSNGTSPFAYAGAGGVFLGKPTSKTVYASPVSGSVTCKIGVVEV